MLTNMKKILTLSCLMLFLINSVAISALAYPCVHKAQPVSLPDIGEQHCHETSQQQTSVPNHCENCSSCLNGHVSNAVIFQHHNTSLFIVPIKLVACDDCLVSINHQPPIDPPRLSS